MIQHSLPRPLSPSPRRPLRTRGLVTPLLRCGLFVIVCLLAQLPVVTLAKTLSMREFMALQPKWEELEQAETTLRLEGRNSATSARLIRLRECPLSFEPATEDFPQLGPNVKRVLITGRLDHRGDEQFFRVFTVEARPSDRENYAIKAAAVDPPDAEDWHALADWARERGTFYDDEFLLAKASEARRRGLGVERIAAGGELETLTKLADRAEEFGEASLAREIRHEALRVRWDRIGERPGDNPKILIQAIRQTLPGANQAIARWPMTLASGYGDQPVATYNGASDKGKNILDRLFLAEVLLREIEAGAQEDGANGDAIAAKIEAALPERTDLAESYRLRAIKYQLAHLETATRNEIVSLARDLRERQRPREARRALENWLKIRETGARVEGPAELTSVAEDYLSLLEDRDAAARLLIEAAAEHPDSQDIPKMLARLGYKQMRGKWLSPEEIAARPPDPLEVAMREGRVAKGMSREQVRKTFGRPEQVARSAGRTRIHSVWLYGGASGLAIHFDRRVDAAADAARVVGISKWRSSP